MSAMAVSVFCPAAAASLRAPGSQRSNANWAATGRPGVAKKRRLATAPHSGSLLLSVAAAAVAMRQRLQDALLDTVAGRPHTAHLSTHLSTAPLLAFEVPHYALQFGDGLRLVGSCAELGDWDPWVSPALEWREGDAWACQVALPPGQHTFKLVIVHQDGSQQWEDGANRSLIIPELPAFVSTPAFGPLLKVTAHVGDTAATEVTANQAGLQAAAAAAAARVAALLVRRTEMAARLAVLQAQQGQDGNGLATLVETAGSRA